MKFILDKLRINKHQASKFGEQLRILAWAVSAYIYHDLHRFSSRVKILVIIFVWMSCQIAAMFLDKGE